MIRQGAGVRPNAGSTRRDPPHRAARPREVHERRPRRAVELGAGRRAEHGLVPLRFEPLLGPVAPRRDGPRRGEGSDEHGRAGEAVPGRQEPRHVGVDAEHVAVDLAPHERARHAGRADREPFLPLASEDDPNPSLHAPEGVARDVRRRDEAPLRAEQRVEHPGHGLGLVAAEIAVVGAALPEPAPLARELERVGAVLEEQLLELVRVGVEEVTLLERDVVHLQLGDRPGGHAGGDRRRRAAEEQARPRGVARPAHGEDGDAARAIRRREGDDDGPRPGAGGRLGRTPQRGGNPTGRRARGPSRRGRRRLRGVGAKRSPRDARAGGPPPPRSTWDAAPLTGR